MGRWGDGGQGDGEMGGQGDINPKSKIQNPKSKIQNLNFLI
ncbi:MAG: hypothetical protein WBA39_12960 [Rivularia sp. (in: cyanobacteria)]